MANIRNNTMSPQPARSGETAQEVRNRWAGEVNMNGGMSTTPTWNAPWTEADSSWGTRPMTMGNSSQMSQSGQMDVMGNQMNQSGQMDMVGSQMGRNGQMDMMGNQMTRNNELHMSQSGRAPVNNGLSMQNNLPTEVIESPTTMNEAYLGSLKAMLLRNKGNYIVATFLVGTQNTVSWEGVLYDVGNDYVTIYQQGRDRYIVSDIYSLRYMEFYDTQRRELCDRLLQRQNGTWETW